MRCWRVNAAAAAACAVFALTPISGAEPAAASLRLHPANPHYFEFRGKPTVLITSGEHYGAVLNLDFDYLKYLDALAADHLNLTRIFCGTYRETPESFNITRNPLAPEESRFVAPFRRVAPGRYDLAAWNPEYFHRLRNFVREASARGVIVEVTLFTTYYSDVLWNLSPLNARNNVQGVGRVANDEALTLKEPALVQAQERFVREVVKTLAEFDNVYFEICNEPYFQGVTEEWQRRMASAIVEAEAALPPERRHLISRNIANGSAEIKDPDPNVSIFNFHYARPPKAVAVNYGLNKPIGMNETGFDGSGDFVYRIQGWDFLLAGGALYNNLDYSFVAGHENGSFLVPTNSPGGGGPTLRRQLKGLRAFMDSLPFTLMRPVEALVEIVDGPDTVSVRALAAPENSVIAAYVHHARVMDGYQPRYLVNTRKRTLTLRLNSAPGRWEAQWWNPGKGAPEMTEMIEAAAKGTLTLKTPEYSEDVALILRRQR